MKILHKLFGRHQMKDEEGYIEDDPVEVATLAEQFARSCRASFADLAQGFGSVRHDLPEMPPLPDCPPPKEREGQVGKPVLEECLAALDKKPTTGFGTISDSEIDRVHGNANFGPDLSKRDIVNQALLKAACGYHQGSTARRILLDHKLINDEYVLTAKGREYLWQTFKLPNSL